MARIMTAMKNDDDDKGDVDSGMMTAAAAAMLTMAMELMALSRC